MRWRSLPLLLLALAALPVSPLAARVGETAAELRKRFGRPEAQPSKDVLVWTIEERAGPLLYTVTLNAQNISIGEGLKPRRHGPLTEESAANFIRDQLSGRADATSARAVKAGERYTFGGEAFVCGEHEQVIVDEASDLLIIWTLRPSPSVLAVTREMLQRTRG